MFNSTISQSNITVLEAAVSVGVDVVLAVIVGVDGASYRPVGAMMAITREGQRFGSLSSGCIEGDITEHARGVMTSRQPKVLRYGAGSPFVDIRLPCGGGLDVLLVPIADFDVLEQACEQVRRRKEITVQIDLETGSIVWLGKVKKAGLVGDKLSIQVLPEIRFCIFGKGPEALSFAALVQSTQFPNVVVSPDEEAIDAANRLECMTRWIHRNSTFPDEQIDDRTAVVLFFHEHDWEPPILAEAVKTEAFYIGAQGGLQSRLTRDAVLRQLGVEDANISKIHGPIGLIPSARDARTLAVSVLAEILEKSRK